MTLSSKHAAEIKLEGLQPLQPWLKTLIRTFKQSSRTTHYIHIYFQTLCSIWSVVFQHNTIIYINNNNLISSGFSSDQLTENQSIQTASTLQAF